MRSSKRLFQSKPSPGWRWKRGMVAVPARASFQHRAMRTRLSATRTLQRSSATLRRRCSAPIAPRSWPLPSRGFPMLRISTRSPACSDVPHHPTRGYNRAKSELISRIRRPSTPNSSPGYSACYDRTRRDSHRLCAHRPAKSLLLDDHIFWSYWLEGVRGYYTGAMIGERTEPLAERLHSALDSRLEGYLRTDDASRALWSTDASIYLRKPVGVVVVRSEEDVELTLSTARDLGLSITPRGTGTSLAGQATAPGLALDVSEMRRALEIDFEGWRCVVEPGVVQGELNAMVEPHGLVFGADTSTSDVATLGGMVGNNSAGMRSLVYGMTSDQVIRLRCVLSSGETVELSPLRRDEARGRARHADSLARLLRGALGIGDRYSEEIKRRFPRMIRRVSGYGLDALIDPDTLDLTRLICGSEGTLAVVTRAEFRLAELPPQRAMASFQFGTLAEAARATVELLEEKPSALELLDDVAIGRARASSAYAGSTRFVRGNPKALLLVEWSGSEEEMEDRFAGLEELASAVGASVVAPLRTSGEMSQTVRLRKSILPLLLGTTDRKKP